MTSFITDPRSQLSSMNGPDPTGFSENDLAFSASVVPAAASNSFCGRIAVLNTLSAGMMLGSARFSVIVIVPSSVAVMSVIALTRNPQMPFSGVAARFSDHATSDGRIGEPSENLIPSRSFNVTDIPSSATFHSVARPGCTPCPSSVGIKSVS